MPASENINKIKQGKNVVTIIRTSKDKGVQVVETADKQIKTFKSIQGQDLLNFINRRR